MRKTIYIIVTIAFIATASLAGMSYGAMRDTNAKMTTVTSENIKLKAKIAKQEVEIKKFDSINKADMLEACSNRARTNYMKYIEDNSVTTKEGLVTTHIPKFPGMIDNAQKELDSAEKDCNDAFGS